MSSDADPTRGAVASAEPSSAFTWAFRQMLITLLESLILAAFAKSLGAAFGRAVPLVGAWAIATICVLAFRLHRLMLPARQRRRSAWHAISGTGNVELDLTLDELGELPTGLRREGTPTRGHQDVSWIDPLPPTLERRFTRMYRHTDRLTYAVVAERHYDSGVRPVLVELAADRLRRYHGVDLATQPAIARELLGAELWSPLFEPLRTIPTTHDLDRWVSALEQLGTSSRPTSGHVPSLGDEPNAPHLNPSRTSSSQPETPA